MTGSSSKLLQIQGKWYRERKPKKNKTCGKKKSKNYSTPLVKFCKGCRHVPEPTTTKRVFQTTTTGLAFFGALSLSLCKILNCVKSVCSQSLLMELFTVFFLLLKGKWDFDPYLSL